VSQEMNDPASWRVMYDSANPSAIPNGALMVAGYVYPSRYAAAWLGPEGFARFPDRPHVHITVAGREPNAELASVVDVESGAFTPRQARAFIRERGFFRPGSATVYVDESNLASVLRACSGLDYWIWLAWWLGAEPSLAAVQSIQDELAPYKTVRLAAWQHSTTPGYDISSVIDPRWHSK